MKDKPRLLFVIPYLHCGGAERVVGNITTNISNYYEVDILVNSTKDVEYEYGGNLISLGIDRFKNVDSPIFQFLVLIRRTLRLKKLKKSGNYAVCISNLDSAHIANILSGNRYCKSILVAHSAMTESSENWKYRLFIVPAVRILYNKADRIVAVSRGVKRDFVDNYGIHFDKIEVIYNGINSKEIDALKSEEIDDNILECISNKKVFCNVGRLDYPKAQWHLIRAFKEVVDICDEAILLILGEGEYRSYLEKLIDGYNLKDNVKLLGFKNNPYSYLEHSDFFIFPSMYEGFPNAPIEALYLGKPVIATDFNYGSREILAPELDNLDERINKCEDTKYGYITPVCDGKKYSIEDGITREEEYLKEAMLNVILNYEEGKFDERFRDVAKERARKFSLENMIDGWIRLIREMIH